MKPLTLHPQPGIELLAVPAREHHHRAEWEKSNEQKVLWLSSIHGITRSARIRLPIGNWLIVGLSDLLAPAQLNGILQRFNNGAYRDYSHKGFDPCDELMPFCLTAKESLMSLIKSHGGGERYYAILKNDKA